MRRPLPKLCIPAAVLALWLGPAANAVTRDAQLDPAGMLERIRTARPDFEGAVAARRHVIPLQEGRFSIREGILIAVGGRHRAPAEFLFLGDGEFYLEPADPVEAGQLRLFSGDAVLETPVTAAVLVLTESGAVEALYKGASSAEVDEELRERAEKLYASWTGSSERRLTHVEARLLEAAVGGPAAEGFLGIWCRTRNYGNLLYRRDPGRSQQLSLLHYVPPDEDAHAADRRKRRIKRKQREGRLVHLEYEDLGDLDVWYQEFRRDGEGRRVPGGVPYESRHYEIEARLTPAKESIAGRTTVTVELLQDAVRVLRFALFPDLEVQDVRDADGHELFHARSRGEVIVVLHTPGYRGQKFDLELSYEGPLLEKIEPGVFFQRASIT